MVPAARPARTAAWKRAAVVRHHDHVDAGRDRRRHRGVVVGIDLVDRPPVRDDEPREPELALEHLGQQVMVAMDLAGTVLENDAMTIRTPAAIASSYGVTWMARNVASSRSVTPWSMA